VPGEVDDGVAVVEAGAEHLLDAAGVGGEVQLLDGDAAEREEGFLDDAADGAEVAAGGTHEDDGAGVGGHGGGSWWGGPRWYFRWAWGARTSALAGRGSWHLYTWGLGAQVGGGDLCGTVGGVRG
jgi:hypothetical protein